MVPRNLSMLSIPTHGVLDETGSQECPYRGSVTCEQMTTAYIMAKQGCLDVKRFGDLFDLIERDKKEAFRFRMSMDQQAYARLIHLLSIENPYAAHFPDFEAMKQFVQSVYPDLR